MIIRLLNGEYTYINYRANVRIHYVLSYKLIPIFSANRYYDVCGANQKSFIEIFAQNLKLFPEYVVESTKKSLYMRMCDGSTFSWYV